MLDFTTSTSHGKGSELICPLLDNPDPECFCLNMSSITIPLAVKFCLRDFRVCPIYKYYLSSPQS